MLLLAVGAVQRPGGVAGQRLELGRRRLDLEFRADQLAHLEREGELPGFEIVLDLHRQLDARPLERRRGVGLDGARDVALHEQPLAVVERRKLHVHRAQRPRLRTDAEQRADEILERTRQLDQQVGLVLDRELVGRRARGHQARMHLDVGVLQPRHERRVEAREALAVVKVMEAEPVAQRRRVHCRISGWREG